MKPMDKWLLAAFDAHSITGAITVRFIENFFCCGFFITFLIVAGFALARARNCCSCRFHGTLVRSREIGQE